MSTSPRSIASAEALGAAGALLADGVTAGAGGSLKSDEAAQAAPRPKTSPPIANTGRRFFLGAAGAARLGLVAGAATDVGATEGGAVEGGATDGGNGGGELDITGVAKGSSPA